MKKIKSLLASALVAMVVLASFGFGVIIVGFAIVVGGAFALALRLGAGDLRSKPDENLNNQDGADRSRKGADVDAAPA